MPAILIPFFVFLLVILTIAVLVPTLIGMFATAIVGKSAKLTAPEISYLKKYFYFVTGILVGVGIGLTEFQGPILFVFNTIITAFIWPLGFSLEVGGMFKEDAGSSLVMFGSVFFGFVLTQVKAVRMVLARADKATNFDPE